MRSGKKFEYAEGKYYFTIKSNPGNITMNRKTKEAAKEAFLKYNSLGKTVEWQGKWNGKNFSETTPPSKKVTAEMN